jgi:arylformamidase
MDLEHEYNMRERVPEHARIISQWEQDAAGFRRNARAEYDLAYGARPRNRVDVFWPAKDKGAVALFIHGGYWRSFDKSVFSHLAKGLNLHGITVAVPSYTLCPEARIGDIIEEMRQLVIYLRNKFKRRIFVFGHSAGGHLAAAMVATKWELFGHANDLVPTAVAISGIFDLRPLLGTSMNYDIRIDEGTARVWSPLFWPSPAGRTFEAWVGRKESDEFIRQSRSIVAPWKGAGVNTGYVEIAGQDHFTVLSPFSNADSELTARLAELALGTR